MKHDLHEEELVFKKQGGWFPWLLALVAIAASAGLYFGLYQPLEKRERQAVAEAEAASKQLEQVKKDAQAEVDKLREEMAALREDLSKSTAQKTEDEKLLEQLKKEIGAGGADVKGEGQQITVTLVDKILFKSASADLSPEGGEVLRKLGAVLKSVDNKLIEVCGHADNLAVESAVKELYPTNWELSTARATNVVRFLQDQAGVKSRRLKAAGYGSSHPVASNATAAGRAKNRRIEILLLPDKIKVTKGDFSDEIAAKQPAGKPSVKEPLPTDADRLKALHATQITQTKSAPLERNRQRKTAKPR